MNTSSELLKKLSYIDHRSYPAYKELTGSWNFSSYILSVDHVQGDPFASPSHLTVSVSLKTAGFPTEYLNSEHRKTALSDYLLRRFSKLLSASSFDAKGSGKSGLLTVTRPRQEIFKRTACEIADKNIYVRFFAGFPAAGRTILAGELKKILFDILPPCIEKAFICKNLPEKEVSDVITLSDDRKYLREELKKRGLAAFIADGSVLPRESGVSDRPLKSAVPFSSPESLSVSFDLPSGKKISGMGIKRGITLIAGGGYHGKSTLLKALERGVYDHIRGDGREYVLTDETAVKLRAEDGRKITDTDISLFIHNLPSKADTSHFSTLDASGSTSQAANIAEAVEADCGLFLIDEDTSATNFMIRDELMQRVISPEKEPITPFIERARQLYEDAGISSILVVGSSGAYFHLADCIIQMDEYRPFDITEKVKNIIAEEKAAEPLLYAPGFKLPDRNRGFKFLSEKAPSDPRREHMKLRMQGSSAFSLNKTTLDLRYLEQLVDSEQTAAIAYLLRYAMENLSESRLTRRALAEKLCAELRENGFSFIFGRSYVASGLALPRIQEIMAAFLRV